MKSGFSVFLAAIVALGAFLVRVCVRAGMQLGTAKQAAVLNSSDVYPIQRTVTRRSACRSIAPTAAPPATPNRSGRTASFAMWF